MYVVHVGRLEAVDEAADVVIGEFRRRDALGDRDRALRRRPVRADREARPLGRIPTPFGS
jgi:hypothetical protein